MSTQTPHSSQTKGLIIAACAGAGAVLLLVIAVLIGYWLGAKQSSPTAIAATAPVAPSATVSRSSLPIQPIITDPVVAAPTATITAETPSNLPLPADTALAGEELDVHRDEQQRLTEQKQNLQQQLQDSSQLSALKEAKIKALEAELAATPEPTS